MLLRGVGAGGSWGMRSCHTCFWPVSPCGRLRGRFCARGRSLATSSRPVPCTRSC